MPYMEEEVKLLTDATLLSEVNGKYITNFFIASKDCQVAVYNLQRDSIAQCAKTLMDIIDSQMPQIRALNIMRNGMSDADFKWFLFTYAAQMATRTYWNENEYQRPDGGNWGFMGFEIQNMTGTAGIISWDGSGTSPNFTLFSYPDYGLWNRNRLNSPQIIAFFADVVTNGRPLSSFSPAELAMWRELDGKYAHADGERIVPDIAIFTKDAKDALEPLIYEQEGFKTQKEVQKQIFAKVVEVLRAEANPILHAHMDYYATMMTCDASMMLVRECVNSGRLVVPAEPETSTVSMWLDMGK